MKKQYPTSKELARAKLEFINNTNENNINIEDERKQKIKRAKIEAKELANELGLEEDMVFESIGLK